MMKISKIDDENCFMHEKMMKYDKTHEKTRLTRCHNNICQWNINALAQSNRQSFL